MLVKACSMPEIGGTVKHRKLRWLTTCAIVVAFGVQPAAGADDGTEEPTPTLAHVVDSDHPMLKIGDKVPDELISGSGAARSAASPEWPEMPERGSVPYEVNLDDYTPEGVARTQAQESAAASPWDPLNECRNQLAGGAGTGLIVKRFTYCSVKKQAFYWRDSNGTVVGTTSYVQTIAGQAPRDRREINYMVNLGYWDIDGHVRDIPFEVKGESLGLPWTEGTGGPGPACEVINSADNPKTLSAWRNNGAAVASIVFFQDKSKGEGRDYVNECQISTLTQGIGYRDGVTPIRFDSASYVYGESGGMFTVASPTLVYNTTSTSHGAVARHIQLALTNPDLTDPRKTGKVIPGTSRAKPLTRLYEQWDANAQRWRNANIAQKNAACTPIKPANATGLDCDEFPFGSTWEGPASLQYDFSVKYLDLAQNRSAGGSLAAFYARERILHRDGFLVRIATS
ncbi:NucA/NucB deoxyribonuclease domain-containing protein [Streptomyces sp. NPDC057854]|uniref:NucA/NucB deoxyribonuclease domain-containing protein n=1 Tax=unclassified Streptomyces TaxID=2593676 RepID=UPI00367E4C0C